MKTSILLLLFCSMSLLLLSFTPANQASINVYSGKIMSPDGDFISRTQGDLANVPVMDANRDRSWHISEILHESDPDLNNVFEPTSKEVIYYNANHPDRVDSLCFMRYDIPTLTYVPVSAKIFIYDATGTNIVQLNWHYAMNPPNLYQKTVYEYDNQNRLIHQYQYVPALETEQILLNYRYYWVYDENSITERYFESFNAENQVSMYIKTVFLHDEQKRNVGFQAWNSTDSLNWVNANDCVTTYNVNDTSTGLDMINYYRFNYIISYYGNAGGYTPYTMIESFTVRNWINDAFAENNRTDYTYYADNHLQNYTNLYVGTHWYNYDRYTYDYDTNGNTSQISYQMYDQASGMWLGYQKISNLTWGEYVGTDDEIAPVNTLGLNVYPNPFKDEVTINLNSKDDSFIEAGIYNLKGQLVRDFTNQKSGKLVWDGKNSENITVSSGIYFIRINQNGHSAVQKIVRVK